MTNETYYLIYKGEIIDVVDGFAHIRAYDTEIDTVYHSRIDTPANLKVGDIVEMTLVKVGHSEITQHALDEIMSQKDLLTNPPYSSDLYRYLFHERRIGKNLTKLQEVTLEILEGNLHIHWSKLKQDQDTFGRYHGK